MYAHLFKIPYNCLIIMRCYVIMASCRGCKMIMANCTRLHIPTCEEYVQWKCASRGKETVASIHTHGGRIIPARIIVLTAQRQPTSAVTAMSNGKIYLHILLFENVLTCRIRRMISSIIQELLVSIQYLVCHRVNSIRGMTAFVADH
jgi:hypothetical protein